MRLNHKSGLNTNSSVRESGLSGKITSKFDPKRVSVFVLCGGYGTRLRDLTKDSVPKPLFPINGKPIIEYNIQPLIDAGVGQINFVVAHQGEKIVRHFETSTIRNTTQITFTDQGEPNGVITGLQLALHKYLKPSDNYFIISDGDTIRHGFEIKEFFLSHKQSRAASTLLTTSVEKTEKHYGVLTNERNYVEKIVCYPPSGTIKDNRIFAGLIMCNKTINKLILKKEHEDLSWYGLLTSLVASGEAGTHTGNFLYFNINSPDVVVEVESILKL